MSEIPDGWRRGRLGDVAELFNGKATGTGVSALRVFKTRHVYDGFLRLSDPAYVPADRVTKVPQVTFLRTGDTLTPNMAHGTIGRVAFVRAAEPNWTIDGQVMVIRPRDDAAVLGRFLFDWLSRPESKRTLVAMEKGGAFDELRGQTHIYRDDVATIPIVLPPLGEQRKISAILSSMDDAIEATQALIDQLGVVKKAMMAELLTRGLPGRHTRFKQTEIGDVPEKWSVLPIERLIDFCDYGLSKSLTVQPGGVAVLRMGNLAGGRVVLDDLKYIDSSEVKENLLLAPGDVLFNRTNSKDLVGKVGVFGGASFKVSFASYLLRLRPTAPHSGHWLGAVMNLESHQAALRAMATPGVSQVNINRGKMIAMKVPVPPPEEQRDLVAILSGLDERLATERAVASQFAAVKAALMSVLLTGEVRVKPDASES